MSQRAIWSLNATRSELDGATKGQIYLAKIGIGFAVAVPLWFAHMGNLSAVLVSTLAVFITSKVCYYLNKNESPDRYSVCDWITDGVLHCAWYLPLCGSWKVAMGMLVAFGLTYAWSSE